METLQEIKARLEGAIPGLRAEIVPNDSSSGQTGVASGSPVTSGAVGLVVASCAGCPGSGRGACTGRTGATGLRPTFGRVSRHGAMALSWSMDKLGPICRSVEGCALVLEARTTLIPSPQHRSLVGLGYPDTFRAADHVMEKPCSGSS